MRILFVRHGNPNYELDCLTELGHKQAEACAERLCKEGIEKIFSSTCGRALETAAHTAEKYGLDVEGCDFIREINWSSKSGDPIPENGNPWFYAEEYIREGRCLVDPNWEHDALFSLSNTPDSFHKVGKGLDEWLAGLGFEREGLYYRVTKPQYDTVAMFCHAGAFSVAISHLFNLPEPFAIKCIPFAQTGVVEVELAGKEGDIVAPRFGGLSSVAHLRDSGVEIIGLGS